MLFCQVTYGFGPQFCPNGLHSLVIAVICFKELVTASFSLIEDFHNAPF